MPKYRNASVLRRLGVRLVLFLSLALIPVGLLGVLQTQEVVHRIAIQSEAYLADRTRAAARAEREAILRSIGAAHGLGQMVLSVGDSDPKCTEQLSQFVASRPFIKTVGFVGIDGIMTCASNGHTFDFSRRPDWHELVEDPRESVAYTPYDPISESPVINSIVPVMTSGTLSGFVFVSQSHETLRTLPEGIEGAKFLTFNDEGEILTGREDGASVAMLLPRDISLESLAMEVEATFTANSRSGDTRVYSVSPIIDGTVYAMGIWSQQATAPGLFGLPIPIPVFPLLMWVTSLVVAYAAVERLALRHIRKLRHDMRQFGRRRILPSEGSKDMAVEIEEIYDTFRATTEIVIRDEAELEQLIHDKNVLLKEVHHRVKNNLQLISSIMNMQMRQMKASEAKMALKRLQSRVLSLATIHRNLYKTQNLGAVQAGELLEELVNQLAALAAGDHKTRIDTRFDSMVLYPDQAVPLSLLTTEAVTNALKYTGSAHGVPAWLKVSLIAESPVTACLVVENSTGTEQALPGDEMTGTGLGNNLIRAFASQLGGELSVEQTDSLYRCTCRFEIQSFSDEDAGDDALD
ncbi:MAG: sensor histidine kinase [Rhodobacteraceae bacterium]|nr:sensor histidine kinase [Paracoccaceae bacterium]